MLVLGALGLLLFSFSRARSYPQYSHSVLLRKVDSKIPRIDIEGWILVALAVTIPLVGAAVMGPELPQASHEEP